MEGVPNVWGEGFLFWSSFFSSWVFLFFLLTCSLGYERMHGCMEDVMDGYDTRLGVLLFGNFVCMSE